MPVYFIIGRGVEPLFHLQLALEPCHATGLKKNKYVSHTGATISRRYDFSADMALVT